MSENSETKWTAGEWRAVMHEIGDSEKWFIQFDGPTFRDSTIASLNSDCMAYSNAENDARLIAAAPKLYAALARLIAELPTKRDWLDPVLEAQAKEALRSARGTR